MFDAESVEMSDMFANKTSLIDYTVRLSASAAAAAQQAHCNERCFLSSQALRISPTRLSFYYYTQCTLCQLASSRLYMESQSVETYIVALHNVKTRRLTLSAGVD